MTSFQFIITFVLTVKILTFLRGITEKIQGRSLDRVSRETKMCLKKVRKKYSSDYNGMLPRNIFIQKKSLKGNFSENMQLY